MNQRPITTDDEGDDAPIVQTLKGELKRQYASMNKHEARFLVDTYYDMQGLRIINANRLRAIKQGYDEGAPATLTYAFEQAEALEHQLKKAITVWADEQPVAQWARTNKGIGPVLAAGLSAHINIVKAPTVGHIYSFAGLAPGIRWLGKEGARKLLAQVDAIKDDDEDWHDENALTPDEMAELESIMAGRWTLSPRQVSAISNLTGRRFQNLMRLAKTENGTITRDSMMKTLAKPPWNAGLKKLCWLVGESFVKVSGKPDAFYGAFYANAKEAEMRRNLAGEFDDQAKAALAREHPPKPGTDAYAAYSKGILPPAHIHARAKRKAVKLFLSHWHYVAYVIENGKEPPAPYAIEQLGHAHHIPVPNWPMA